MIEGIERTRNEEISKYGVRIQFQLDESEKRHNHKTQKNNVRDAHIYLSACVS